MHPIPERHPAYWLGLIAPMWGSNSRSKHRNPPRKLERGQRINRYCANLTPTEAAYVRFYADNAERATMHDNWLSFTLSETRRGQLRARVDRILRNS